MNEEMHIQTALLDRYPQSDVVRAYVKEGRLMPTSATLVDREARELPDGIEIEEGLWAYIQARVEQDQQGRGTIGLATEAPSVRDGITDVELRIMGGASLAERAVNGLKSVIRVMPDGRRSEYGELSHRSRENPALADHNFWHERRTERTLEAILFNTRAIYESPHASRWIDSAMLFASFHDEDQRISIQRNIDEERGNGEERQKPLRVKQGHALAGAVMMLAMHKRYAYERVVSEEEGWRMAAGSAFMMMKHDEPEKIVSHLSSDHADAREINISNPNDMEELRVRFRNGAVDLATLSPHQMMEILREEKRVYKGRQTGFVGNGSAYGLHPDFEREYAEELALLHANNDAILPELDLADRDALNLVAEAAVRADMMEMVAPPVEAIFRTMLTQYSQSRPWYPVDEDVIRDYAEGVALRAADHEFDREAEFLDIMQYVITHGEGNVASDIDSDTRRLLLEFVQLSSPNSKDLVSDLGESEYIQAVNRDNAILGLLSVQHIGRQLMEGDLAFLQEYVDRNTEKLAEKALRQIGVTPQQMEAMKTHEHKSFLDQAHDLIWQRQGEEASVRLRRVIAHIRATAVQVAQSIEAKQEAEGEGNRVAYTLPWDEAGRGGNTVVSLFRYQEDQIQVFEQLTNQILQSFQHQLQITPEEMAEYHRIAERGGYSSYTPYSTYESTGNHGRSKKIRHPVL